MNADGATAAAQQLAGRQRCRQLWAMALVPVSFERWKEAARKDKFENGAAPRGREGPRGDVSGMGGSKGKGAGGTQ